MTNTTQETQYERFRFLKCLYDETESDEFVYVNPTVLGTALGYSISNIERICDFLRSEGLIVGNIMDFISITHKGIVEVENALSKPDEPTSYFPPTNSFIIHIGQITDSQLQVQQGANQSSQVLTQSVNDLDAILKVVTDLKNQLPKLNLDIEAHAVVESDISTIESQIKSPHPKFSVIKECLASSRTILEGVVGSMIAAGLLQQIIALTK